jgi:hypothetical protein
MTTQLNEILGKAFHEFQGGNYSQAETLLESAYQQMMERYYAGLGPEDLTIV